MRKLYEKTLLKTESPHGLLQLGHCTSTFLSFKGCSEESILSVLTFFEGSPEINCAASDESALGVKHTQKGCLSRCIATARCQRALLLQRSVNTLCDPNGAEVTMCDWKDGSSVGGAHLEAEFT